MMHGVAHADRPAGGPLGAGERVVLRPRTHATVLRELSELLFAGDQSPQPWAHSDDGT